MSGGEVAEVEQRGAKSGRLTEVVETSSNKKRVFES